MTRLWDRLIRRYGDTFWEGQASGASVLTTTYAGPDREPVLPQLAAYAQQANSGNAVIFAAILVRMSLFSEARFQFQAKDDRHLFGTTALAKLEKPFGPESTTGHLLARMEQDAFLAGQRLHLGRARRGPPGPAAARLDHDRVRGGARRRGRLVPPPGRLLVRAAEVAVGAGRRVHGPGRGMRPLGARSRTRRPISGACRR